MRLNLQAFTSYQLTSAPRPADESLAHADANAARSLAALIAAHAQLAQPTAQAQLLSIRMREPASELFRLIVGAAPSLPGVRRTAVESGLVQFHLPHPPGTIGKVLEARELESALAKFEYWVRCVGSTDPIWTTTDQGQLDFLSGSFSTYTAHIPHPFVWLVVAEPLQTADVELQILNLEVEIPRLRLRTNSESDRLAVARAEARYRELAQARVRGAWTVHIMVGANTPGQCRGAAATLCAATEIHRLPYALMPDHHLGQFVDVCDEEVSSTPARAGSSPFLAGPELLAALTSPPEVELPGIQLTATNPFDVTADDVPEGGLELGTVLDATYQAAGPMNVTRSTLNRHAFVAGATGSGKSQTTRHLLQELSMAQPSVPWLVIEPAKAEYARMAGRLPKSSPVLRIRPGELGAAPVTINPLEPAAEFPLQSHLDFVRALFLAAFQADEPFPQVLSQALTRAYMDAGWDLVTGRPRPEMNPKYLRDEPSTPAEPRYPKLDDLQAAARSVVNEIGYGKEVAANVRGFIDVRIGSLLIGTPGRLFRGGHPLDFSRLLKQNVVLELEDITDDQDKAFVMGAVIIRIVEHLRVAHGKNGLDDLAHITVIEEAHRLLKASTSGPAAASVDLFASLLAEIRAYGEGIVVVEQIPSKLIPDVIKNSALKGLHRLPAVDDRAAVGATINLTRQQSESVVSLRPGIAAAAVDGMDRPLMIRIPPLDRRETADDAHSIAPLADRRSKLCAEECWKSEVTACTLNQINAAGHRAKVPLVRIWSEAITVAYLIGVRLPVLSDEVAAELERLESRALVCALGHAVDASLASRWNHLRRYFVPEQFEIELFNQLNHQVMNHSVGSFEFRRWLAGPYRWADIKRQLRNAGAGDIPRSQIDLWRQRGALLTGRDPVTLLKSLSEQAQRQPTSSLLGDSRSTGLVAAIHYVAGSADQESVLFALNRACVGPTEALADEIFRGLSREASS